MGDITYNLRLCTYIYIYKRIPGVCKLTYIHKQKTMFFSSTIINHRVNLEFYVDQSPVPSRWEDVVQLRVKGRLAWSHHG